MEESKFSAGLKIYNQKLVCTINYTQSMKLDIEIDKQNKPLMWHKNTNTPDLVTFSSL